jgi:PAS domain-containing protein
MAFQRVHPDDRDFVRQAHEYAINEKTDFNVEHRLLMPDGAVKHVHVIGRALQTSSGDLEFVGAGTDVTAAKLAEEQIRQSESELRQILDFAPQHVYVLGPDPDTGTRGFVMCTHSRTTLLIIGICFSTRSTFLQAHRSVPDSTTTGQNTIRVWTSFGGKRPNLEKCSAAPYRRSVPQTSTNPTDPSLAAFF